MIKTQDLTLESVKLCLHFRAIPRGDHLLNENLLEALLVDYRADGGYLPAICVLAYMCAASHLNHEKELAAGCAQLECLRRPLRAREQLRRGALR